MIEITSGGETEVPELLAHCPILSELVGRGLCYRGSGRPVDYLLDERRNLNGQILSRLKTEAKQSSPSVS